VNIPLLATVILAFAAAAMAILLVLNLRRTDRLQARIEALELRAVRKP
jgi:hypothetical protein